MPGCHAEQLEFLIYGLRFARFYFRIISLPNLSNRNHSLPEPWRHARVHAIWCTHRWKAPPPPPHPPCIITEWPPLRFMLSTWCSDNAIIKIGLPSILPPPPPTPQFGNPKPLVAIDNLGWAISLRKLNRDLEEKTKPVSNIHKTFFC